MIRLARIGGDGIGPEVVAAAVRVVEAVCAGRVEWVEAEMGWAAFERTGRALPEATLETLGSCAGALFGAVSSPGHAVEGYRSPIVEIRRRLDLYWNVRPLRTSVGGAVDAVVVRENTEGLYAGREHWEQEGEVAIAERVISRRASERIARSACELAVSRAESRLAGDCEAAGSGAGGRGPRLTVVHKANVLRLSDGLFREAALEVAAGFPEIEVEEQLVDSMAYRLILEPERYDVIVAPNLYGDILSDLGAALVGGLGIVGSANCGDGFCLAEPVHGSAPDIAGEGIANPTAAVTAAALLLDRVGLRDEAVRVEKAVEASRRDGPRTPDQGGTATTEDVVADLLARV